MTSSFFVVLHACWRLRWSACANSPLKPLSVIHPHEKIVIIGLQFLLVLHFTINGVMVCFSAAEPIFGCALSPDSKVKPELKEYTKGFFDVLRKVKMNYNLRWREYIWISECTMRINQQSRSSSSSLPQAHVQVNQPIRRNQGAQCRPDHFFA
jgi:hypothetical protein